LFAESAECAVPAINVQLIGIDHRTVNLESDHEQGDESMFGIKPAISTDMR